MVVKDRQRDGWELLQYLEVGARSSARVKLVLVRAAKTGVVQNFDHRNV